ncbi:Ig kappa chain V-II region FR [Fukomys damarensis]|uniref:Ig kappa chain V-II region FR n=1 Tax=Fukomys damarensis TaxID=885580 RepID=A0A091DAL2_FUKDA|nr:Ig kappa chain V-II region FR [Fukomys damarensis]
MTNADATNKGTGQFKAPIFIEMNGQQVKQFPQFQHIWEGENFTTYCNSSGILVNLQWYKQKPGGRPVLLMILTKGGEGKKQERLTARYGEKRKDSSLHITATQTTDAGTYFCAVAQCSPGTCC